MLIPMVIVCGATVDQVHSHSKLAKQYAVECAKHCPWKGSGGIIVVIVIGYWLLKLNEKGFDNEIGTPLCQG